MKKIESLMSRWLLDICPGGCIDYFVEIVKKEVNSETLVEKIIFNLYTEKYKYNIIAVDKDEQTGYLGCFMSNRKPEAGEKHTRGRDLPDGEFNYDTWNRIKDSIIKTELVELIEPCSYIENCVCEANFQSCGNACKDCSSKG